MAVPAVHLQSVAKVYPTGVEAVRSVTLDLHPGEITGLLGPNGAGKTTLMKMLAGILRPTAGRIVYGQDDIWQSDEKTLRRLKQNIGFLPERPFLYPKLTAHEYLHFVGGLYGIADPAELECRIRALLGQFHLDRDTTAFLKTYSQGMQKKVALAAALINKPDVLILDEPTNGLDPRSARLLKDIMVQQRRENRIILLSTHLLEVAERLCDRIAILDRGELKFYGTVEALRNLLYEPPDASLEDLFLRLTDSGEGDADQEKSDLE